MDLPAGQANPLTRQTRGPRLGKAVLAGLVMAGLGWVMWANGGKQVLNPPPLPIPAADGQPVKQPMAKAVVTRLEVPGTGGSDNGPKTAPAKALPLLQLYRRWLDAESLAGATSRIALAGPVGALQQLQREAEALAVPACLADSKAALVDLSALGTQAFLRFMQRDEMTSAMYQRVERLKAVELLEWKLATADC